MCRQFAGRAVYIAGESYGGVLVPMFANAILDVNKKTKGNSKKINIKGVMVGNGQHSVKLVDNSYSQYVCRHALVDPKLCKKVHRACGDRKFVRPHTWKKLPAHEKRNTKRPSARCRRLHQKVENCVDESGVNPYNIYAKCATCPPDCTSKRKARYKKDKHGCNTVDCTSQKGTGAFFNSPAVRKAFHVHPKAKNWCLCNSVRRAGYKQSKGIGMDLVPVYARLMKHIKVGIYHGDADTNCNFMQGFDFVQAISKHAGGLRTPFKFWKVNSQVAGSVTKWSKLMFTTIKGAGHMAPHDKPAEALHMLESFLTGREI